MRAEWNRYFVDLTYEMLHRCNLVMSSATECFCDSIIFTLFFSWRLHGAVQNKSSERCLLTLYPFSLTTRMFAHVKKVKERIAVNGFPSHSYGTSLAILDHTVLPTTQHKWTRPALTPASKLVLYLLTPEGWKAELTYGVQQCTGWESNSWSFDH